MNLKCSSYSLARSLLCILLSKNLIISITVAIKSRNSVLNTSLFISILLLKFSYKISTFFLSTNIFYKFSNSFLIHVTIIIHQRYLKKNLKTSHPSQWIGAWFFYSLIHQGIITASLGEKLGFIIVINNFRIIKCFKIFQMIYRLN